MGEQASPEQQAFRRSLRQAAYTEPERDGDEPVTKFAITGTCSWCPSDMPAEGGHIWDGLEFCSCECADEYAQQCRRVTTGSHHPAYPPAMPHP